MDELVTVERVQDTGFCWVWFSFYNLLFSRTRHGLKRLLACWSVHPASTPERVRRKYHTRETGPCHIYRKLGSTICIWGSDIFGSCPCVRAVGYAAKMVHLILPYIMSLLWPTLKNLG